MPKSERSEPMHDDPIGIVISRGTRSEPSPVVRAFVYGPAPEQPATRVERPAA